MPSTILILRNSTSELDERRRAVSYELKSYLFFPKSVVIWFTRMSITTRARVCMYVYTYCVCAYVIAYTCMNESVQSIGDTSLFLLVNRFTKAFLRYYRLGPM
jgi:hypothetical protein